MVEAAALVAVSSVSLSERIPVPVRQSISRSFIVHKPSKSKK